MSSRANNSIHNISFTRNKLQSDMLPYKQSTDLKRSMPIAKYIIPTSPRFRQHPIPPSPGLRDPPTVLRVGLSFTPQPHSERLLTRPCEEMIERSFQESDTKIDVPMESVYLSAQLDSVARCTGQERYRMVNYFRRRRFTFREAPLEPVLDYRVHDFYVGHFFFTLGRLDDGCVVWLWSVVMIVAAGLNR